jgi:Ca2+-binding EF-hand superfamily protein
VVTQEEALAAFQAKDQNGDGVLSKDEMRRGKRGRGRHGHGRRGGPAFGLIRAADQDKDRTVTAAEWQTFLASVDAGGGLVSTDALLGAMSRKGKDGQAQRPQAADKAARRTERLTKALDRDGDQALELEDLEAVFTQLDKDQSGALEGGELGRKGRRHGGRKAGQDR